MSAIILDAIVIFTFIVTVYFAYRRGFLHTVLRLISYLVSLFVASMASSALADWIFEHWIRPVVVSHLTEKFTAALAQGTMDTVIQEINDKIPNYFSHSLLEGKNIMDAAQTYLSSQNVDGAVTVVTNQIVTPVIVSILSFFLFFLIFFLCKLIFRFIYRAAGVVWHIPVIHLINGLMGGLLGVFEAFLFNLLIAMVVYLVIFCTGDTLSWLNTEIVEQTSLFILFYRFNPLLLF